MRVLEHFNFLILLNDLDLIADDRKCEILILASSDDTHDHAYPSKYTNNRDTVHDTNDNTVVYMTSYIR